MNEHIFRYPGKLTWDDEIAENTEMFFEADRLDAAAYDILNKSDHGNEDWERFTDAKSIADAKRTAAYQDWMRIKRQMKK